MQCGTSKRGTPTPFVSTSQPTPPCFCILPSSTPTPSNVKPPYMQPRRKMRAESGEKGGWTDRAGKRRETGGCGLGVRRNDVVVFCAFSVGFLVSKGGRREPESLETYAVCDGPDRHVCSCRPIAKGEVLKNQKPDRRRANPGQCNQPTPPSPTERENVERKGDIKLCEFVFVAEPDPETSNSGENVLCEVTDTQGDAISGPYDTSARAAASYEMIDHPSMGGGAATETGTGGTFRSSP